MFETLPKISTHPLLQIYGALARDTNPNKIDLGIGVYRDAHGDSPIMGTVRSAMLRLAETQKTKEYVTPAGNRRYCRLTEELVLGASHPALQSKRVVSYQTPGAGGGLRIAAELIRQAKSNATVWVPNPTWDHQLHVLESAGVRVGTYPYYDRTRNALAFEKMLAAVSKVAAGDVLLLHGCCHNPTGEDPTREQWAVLAQLCQERRIVPFIDLVYQGFGDGIDEDVFGTRLLATLCDEAILVTSASKSFGIYRDRAGTITLVARDSGHIANIERHLAQIASGLYFMPPDFGAAVVAQVLSDTALREQWQSELAVMRRRIADLRMTVVDLFKRRLQGWDWDFLGGQKGMFSLLPLSPEDIVRLRTEHSIYMMPDARINLAALTAEKAEHVVDAIADVLSETARG